MFRKWFPLSKMPSSRTTSEECASPTNQKPSPLPTRSSHRLKMHTQPLTPRDKLSLETITSPPIKKSKTTFGSLVYDLEEDEK